MEIKKFKPKLDKFFWAIWIPTSVLMIAITVVAAFEPVALLIVLPLDVFVFYFLVSSLFGYVELREDAVFIKFGFILKREIPYGKIRGAERERKVISPSMLSLKNALEHVNIKYNTFDVVTVSVIGNDELIRELERRMAGNAQ